MDEPAILHATLAFSCAHRAYQSSIHFSLDRQPGPQEQFVLRHYGKLFPRYVHISPRRTRHLFVSRSSLCVLFICLDLVRGCHTSGLQNLRNGSRLLNRLRPTTLPWVEQPRDSTWGFTAGTVERTLADILGKFCFQAVLLGQPSSFDVGHCCTLYPSRSRVQTEHSHTLSYCYTQSHI